MGIFQEWSKQVDIEQLKKHTSWWSAEVSEGEAKLDVLHEEYIRKLPFFCLHFFGESFSPAFKPRVEVADLFHLRLLTHWSLVLRWAIKAQYQIVADFAKCRNLQSDRPRPRRLLVRVVEACVGPGRPGLRVFDRKHVKLGRSDIRERELWRAPKVVRPTST